MKQIVVIIVINFISSFYLNAQSKTDKIELAYKQEAKIYFDSAAKAVDNTEWYSTSLYNRSKFGYAIAKIIADNVAEKEEVLKTKIDKVATSEFKLPDAYLRKVRKRLKENH